MQESPEAKAYNAGSLLRRYGDTTQKCITQEEALQLIQQWTCNLRQLHTDKNTA